MSHDIIVCIPCKLVMHGERNLGIHTKFKHQLDKIEAENQKIIVRIGVCENSNWKPCPDSHNRPANPEELAKAMMLIKFKII